MVEIAEKDYPELLVNLMAVLLVKNIRRARHENEGIKTCPNIQVV